MKKKQLAAQLDWAYAEEKVKLDYLESCKNAISSDEKFNIFRTNPEYGIVLESGEKGIGKNNLRRLKKMAGAKWVENSIEIIAENDKFGGPELHSFDELLVKCSSSSIQYGLDYFNIKTIIGDTNGKSINVVEVGAGFGGLARLLCRFENIEKYTIIDFPEVCALAKRYLENYPECLDKIAFIDASDIMKSWTQLEPAELFIASASVAELNNELQCFYFTNFIQKADWSYIVYNSVHKEENLKFLSEFLENSEQKGLFFKVLNPWFRILHIFFSRNEKSIENINGLKFESLEKYLGSYKFLLKRIIRSIYFKVTNKY